MEPELGNPEWISKARSFVMSLSSEATDDVLRSLAPDVTFRVLGHHSLSGTFSGRDEVAGHLQAMVNQTNGRVDPVKTEDWMLGLSHVSILADVNAEVGSAEGLLRLLILIRFSTEDLIENVTVFFSDPDVAERLYGHFLRDGSSRKDS